MIKERKVTCLFSFLTQQTITTRFFLSEEKCGEKQDFHFEDLTKKRMGADGSKSNDGNDQQRRDLRMRQNADLAKHVAQENVNERGANKQNVERVLLILIQSTEKQNVKKDEKKQVSIDGVNYTITQFLNKGGFGEVYKAHSHQHNKDVAIKIMMNTPEIREEIENEIKFLQLTKNIRIKNHPVIDYFGCEIRNEGIFIAMELAVCDLLTFWFNQMSDKDPKDKFLFGFLIIAYVLRALIFLEKLNIIHGDIKPQNLVIVQGNQCFYVKLIDFGTVEKMSTNRHQLTVDFNKAHTLYFASPEFLKRDSNRMISRHLNKKSDAWAAGVMFYLLFFERLPWKDQYDYENFCNDPNARDIIVPEQGGYKLIIELLLKKNPRDRSSAKDTLMQIKSHPVLGDLLSTIQQTFYPVDDVCHINVPIQLKQQLGFFHFIEQTF